MKLSVVGQSTLAAAIREGCRRHFDVTDQPEPDADVLWVAYDTPIGVNGINDAPDVPWVLSRIRADLAKAGPKPLVLISSQLPVGTTKLLEDEFPQNRFAHSPENIRVAHAVSDFRNQARIVVGVRFSSPDFHADVALINKLLDPFTERIVYVTTEEAEMVKHALNCYLGMSIAFSNEIGRLCASMGVNGVKVMECLLNERRISPNAPLRPGAPFGLGHLARDIFTVNRLAKQNKVSVPIIAAITESNGTSL